MRVVIASDKFRGTLTSAEANAAMSAGVVEAVPTATVDRCRVADGGEGTAAALVHAVGGRWVPCRVTGPLPERKVDAGFALLADAATAVVEVAAASGLALLPDGDRDPLATTTFGTGELIAAAVRAGARRVLLALGGSATVDAGVGAAQACGFTILTVDGEPASMTEPLCGRDLSNVLMVKHGRGEITGGVEVVGLCDVTNPLCGPTGAARTFGPQKGASPAAVEQLDHDLRQFAGRLAATVEAERPGAGAAGGFGFAVLTYFRGTLRGGFDAVAEATGLAERLVGADLCLTGEGCFDATTADGKTVAGVARLCAAAGVPCVAVVGAQRVGASAVDGLAEVVPVVDGRVTAEQSTRDPHRLLASATARAIRRRVRRGRDGG